MRTVSFREGKGFCEVFLNYAFERERQADRVVVSVPVKWTHSHFDSLGQAALDNHNPQVPTMFLVTTLPIG